MSSENSSQTPDTIVITTTLPGLSNHNAEEKEELLLLLQADQAHDQYLSKDTLEQLLKNGKGKNNILHKIGLLITKSIISQSHYQDLCKKVLNHPYVSIETIQGLIKILESSEISTDNKNTLLDHLSKAYIDPVGLHNLLETNSMHYFLFRSFIEHSRLLDSVLKDISHEKEGQIFANMLHSRGSESTAIMTQFYTNFEDLQETYNIYKKSDASGKNILNKHAASFLSTYIYASHNRSTEGYKRTISIIFDNSEQITNSDNGNSLHNMFKRIEERIDKATDESLQKLRGMGIKKFIQHNIYHTPESWDKTDINIIIQDTYNNCK